MKRTSRKARSETSASWMERFAQGGRLEDDACSRSPDHGASSGSSGSAPLAPASPLGASVAGVRVGHALEAARLAPGAESPQPGSSAGAAPAAAAASSGKREAPIGLSLSKEGAGLIFQPEVLSVLPPSRTELTETRRIGGVDASLTPLCPVYLPNGELCTGVLKSPQELGARPPKGRRPGKKRELF